MKYKFNLAGETLQMTAQGVLAMRASARSIESFVDSVEPMAGSNETRALLVNIRVRARDISNSLQSLYNDVAKEAFMPPGAESKPQLELEMPEDED